MALDASTILHDTLRRHSDDILILTEAEAAKLTCLSTRTLQRLADNGRGPSRIQLTKRRVGYWRHDVVAWLNTRTAPTKQAA